MRSRVVAVFVGPELCGCRVLGRNGVGGKGAKAQYSVASAFKPNGKPMPNSGKENGGKPSKVACPKENTTKSA